MEGKYGIIIVCFYIRAKLAPHAQPVGFESFLLLIASARIRFCYPKQNIQ